MAARYLHTVDADTDDGSGPASQTTTCPQDFPCLPTELRGVLADTSHQVVIHSRDPLRKGTRIYLQGEPFLGLYAIRSGCVKKYELDANGEEHITGFFFRGHVLGLSGIGAGTYDMTAEVLDTAFVCRIAFHRFDEIARTNPDIQRRLYQLLGRQYRDERRLQRILRAPSAESRVAAFLVYLTEHFARRGLSSSRVRLPMNRKEIANYLGLTVETVSRTFSRLAKAGMLRVDNRDIEITDSSQLYEVGGVCFL